MECVHSPADYEVCDSDVNKTATYVVQGQGPGRQGQYQGQDRGLQGHGQKVGLND